MDIQNKIAKIESFLEKASRMHPAYKIFIISSLILLMFSPGINEYLQYIFDQHYFYRDERLFLPPFYKYLPDPIPTDDVKEYYFAVMIPSGFNVLMKFIYAHLDVHLWIGLIKLINLTVLIILVGIVAWELGGAISCFASVALLLYTKALYDFVLNGVMPRMFTYTFMVMAILFMLRKRIYAMAALVVFSSVIYPQATFILGTLMAIWLLFVQTDSPIAVNNWSFYKKISILAIVALITFGTVIPHVISNQAYGKFMTLYDLPLYPEIGQNGRYGNFDGLPHEYFYRDMLLMELSIFTTNCSVFLYLLLSFGTLFAIGSNFKTIYKENPKIMAVFVLTATGFITHTFSYIFSPYLFIPIRYFYYTIPLLFIFITPIAFEKLFKRCFVNQKMLSKIFTAWLIGLVAMMNNSAITSRLDRQSPDSFKVFNFSETLPKEVVMAGWPHGIVNDIPLFAHRNAFLAFATHDVFFKNSVIEMRKRMYAIIDVYFAKSIDPLLRLRDEFHVTHFIIDKKYFSDTTKLDYIAPFDVLIKEKLKAMPLKDGILMSDNIKPAIIYEDEKYIILGLDKLLTPTLN